MDYLFIKKKITGVIWLFVGSLFIYHVRVKMAALISTILRQYKFVLFRKILVGQIETTGNNIKHHYNLSQLPNRQHIPCAAG